MDPVIERTRRRPGRGLWLALPALAAGAGACVSVLGLSDDRYESAGTALCLEYETACAGLVDSQALWNAPLCSDYLPQWIERTGTSPATLNACFGALPCDQLLACLAANGVTFATDTGVAEGDLCLDVCLTPPACAPWLCGGAGDTCSPVGDAGVNEDAGADADAATDEDAATGDAGDAGDAGPDAAADAGASTGAKRCTPF